MQLPESSFRSYASLPPLVGLLALFSHGDPESVGVHILRHPRAEYRHRLLDARHALRDHLLEEGVEVGDLQPGPATSGRDGLGIIALAAARACMKSQRRAFGREF